MLTYYADPNHYINPELSDEELKEKKNNLVNGLKRLRSEKG